MIKAAVPLTPRALALLALLMVLGYLGNYASVPLFFGVDFLFGSIAVLIVVSLYGPLWGLPAALVAGSYTLILWSHPYALIIFVLEALFVGFFLQKGRGGLLPLDGLFWLVIGMPAVWVFYGLLMQMGWISTLLIMLKQGVNGLFNALVASLAITYLPFRRILGPDPRVQTTSLRESMLSLLMAFILVPALLVMLFNSQAAKQGMEAATVEEMQRVSADIAGQLDIWYQRNFTAVTELAARAARGPLSPSPALQQDTEFIHQALPNFRAMYVGNAQGTAIAFSPRVDERGQTSIGMNFADRPYFKELQATRQPVISEVFVGRGAAFSPTVTLSAPILRGEQFQGYALGSLDLHRLQEMIEPYGKLRGLAITLLDSQGRVISSTIPDRKPLMPWKPPEMVTLKLVSKSVYHWYPGDETLPPMTRWRRSFYVQETAIAGLSWKLILEAPLAPLQNRLFTIYIRNLGIMAGMAALALLIAMMFSRWLVRPLEGLARVTGNLPDKLLAHQDINWPVSSATEIHSLVANFQAMAQTMKTNFEKLQERSHQLLGVNAGLEQEIAERAQIEAALRRSEDLLRNSFTSIPDLLTVQDRDFNIVMSNWHGHDYIPEEERVAGVKCYQVYMRRDRPCDPCLMTKVLETGEPQQGVSFNPVDGRTRENVAYPICDDSGQVIMVAEHVRDITSRRQMEEALRHSEERYRLLAENALDVIWNMDLNQNFTYISPAIKLLTGFTAEEALTMRLEQLLTPASLTLAQENIARLQEIELREKPPLPPSISLEMEHRRQDGGTVWTEVHATLFRDCQGNPTGIMGVSRDITERRQAREALEQANAQLQTLVRNAEERNRHMALLNEMSDILQRCQTSEEALASINQFLPKFFPANAGALYLSCDSPDLLSPVTTWGEPPPAGEAFPPEDCWAIRTGRPYQVTDPATELLCKHISATDVPGDGYLCVPLLVQDASQGILHIRLSNGATPEERGAEIETKQRLALTITENLSLSLANLKLRETLQSQAIHDPLTGLFNRRYLEETLDQKLYRAQRQKTPLGVVIMDLDHFQDLCITYGLAAGDAFFGAVADLIKTTVTKGDIAGRYSNEEFLLIFLGATLSEIQARAEHLRQAVKSIKVRWQGQLLKSTTISMGVATFPEYGATVAELVAAAFAALCRAKHAGRDRVEIAESNSPATITL